MNKHWRLDSYSPSENLIGISIKALVILIMTSWFDWQVRCINLRWWLRRKWGKRINHVKCHVFCIVWWIMKQKIYGKKKKEREKKRKVYACNKDGGFTVSPTLNRTPVFLFRLFLSFLFFSHSLSTVFMKISMAICTSIDLGHVDNELSTIAVSFSRSLDFYSSLLFTYRYRIPISFNTMEMKHGHNFPSEV